MRPARLALPSGIAPIAALIFASLIWGTADVAGKVALEALPPAMLTAMRFGVAFAFLWPLARWSGGARVPWRVTAPLGALGVALAFLLQPQVWHLTGGALVVAGVWAAVREPRQAPPQPSPAPISRPNPLLPREALPPAAVAAR